MLKALVKNRLQSLLGSMTGAGRTKKKRSPAMALLFGLLMVYCFGVFAVMFGMLFGTLAQPCAAAGLAWFYFALAALMGFALMVVGSVFMTKTQLYEAKDNELLLAMPVPPSAILASRMIMLWVFAALFGLVVAAPAGVMWQRKVGFDALGGLSFILVSLLLPFLALAVSGVFGWLLALAGSRVRNKSLVSTLFSLAFLGAYFYVYSQANVYVQYLASHTDEVAQNLGAVAPLVWAGRACAGGGVLYLVLTLLCELVPFGLMWVLLSRTFLRVATAHRGFARVRYREKALRTRSADSALLQKELRRFTSCSGYMLNAGLGLVFLAAAGVFVLVRPDYLAGLTEQALPGAAALLPLIAVGALCLMQSMILISAPSISLEGSRLWIVQSLPVAPVRVLLAKVRLHCVLAVPPTLFCSAAVAFALRPDALGTVLLLVTPVLFCVFCAALGVMVNLRHPRFDWVNEMQPIKQGMSVILVMLYSFLAVFLPFLAYFLWLGEVLSGRLFLVLFTLLCALLDAAVFAWLARRGPRLFAELN